MCGLLYAKRKDNRPVAKSLLKRYRNQANRGKQGFGYITIRDGKIENYRRFTTEAEMEKELIKETAPEIMFHHRLPTSTPNESEFNHPFILEHKSFKHNYYFMHNGVISNDDTLKDKHDTFGYKYQTLQIKTVTTTTTKEMGGEVDKEIKTEITEKFNDSEALGYEVARYLEGLQNNIEAIGSIAFICIQTDKKDNVKKLFYGRNAGNPLILEKDSNSDMLFLKSEGAGHKIDEDELVSVDYFTGDVEIENVEIGRTYSYKSSEPASTYRTVDKTQNRFGFDTTHYIKPSPTYEQEDIQYSSEDELTDEAVLQNLMTDLEISLEHEMDKEFQLVDELKTLRAKLHRTFDKYEIWDIQEQIKNLTEDLQESRAKIKNIESQQDQLSDIEDEMATKQAKLLEASL